MSNDKHEPDVVGQKGSNAHSFHSLGSNKPATNSGLLGANPPTSSCAEPMIGVPSANTSLFSLETSDDRAQSGDEGDSDFKPLRARKRPAPPLSDIIPSSSVRKSKQSASTSAEQKRNREKLRRSELNESLDDLSELVFQIDPSIRSGRAEEVGMEDQQSASSLRKNTITNRTELIQCTVRLLKRIHAQNQEKDKRIADLQQAHPQMASQPGRQERTNVRSVLTNSSKGSSPNASLLVGTGGAYQGLIPQRGPHNPGEVTQIPFSKGTVASPGLIFPNAFHALLSDNSNSIAGYQGATSQFLFGAAISDREQQQGDRSNETTQKAAKSTQETKLQTRPAPPKGAQSEVRRNDQETAVLLMPDFGNKKTERK